MKELREQKNEIRARYKALRRGMAPTVKQEYDRTICNRFLSLASYRYAEVLLFYSPLPGEIDIMPIARDALSRGKKIAFPLCQTESNTMTYHYITDLSQLKPGSFGISEPSPELEMYDVRSSENVSSICFVPALAYDKAGYRIGYGKGYYDRFLAEFKGSRIGVVYSDFILPSVPRGKFDLNVNVLVTEKGVKTTNAD